MSDDRLNSVEEERCLAMRGEKITCGEFVAFVGGFHDGELVAAQCQLLETHLTECQKCRDYLKAYRTTIRLAKAAMEDLEEQAVSEELVKAILLSARSQQK
jgi:predicted anti-sigma-YlaC factor YlaD